MRILQTAFLCAALILSMPGASSAQFMSREVPMWEGVEKTELDRKNDTEFVEKMLKLSDGDRREAAFQAMQSGWQFIGNNDPNGAIRRFNQAWLVKPDLAEIHWGYAIATHIRGDDLKEVQRHLATAEKALPDNARLLSDHGRILEQRGMVEDAIPYFKRSLEIEPDYAPSHIGMIRAAEKLGDVETQKKHQAIFDKLNQ